MACAACERRRQAMKDMLRKAAEHAARLAGLRKGNTDGKAEVATQPAEARAVEAEGASAAGQAADAPAAHRKRTVAKAEGSRAGKGRASVQGVRKARRG